MPAGAHAQSSDVAALQAALRASAHSAGDVDGLAGPGTAAAVRRSQARPGPSADGIPGPVTRRPLGPHGRPTLGRGLNAYQWTPRMMCASATASPEACSCADLSPLAAAESGMTL